MARYPGRRNSRDSAPLHVDPGPCTEAVDGPATGTARRLAVHVERGAAQLPFATKCLPRAMALGWLLRHAGIAYDLTFAARPRAVRQQTLGGHDDTLHAWVEVGGVTVIGALPGPWLAVLTLRG